MNCSCNFICGLSDVIIKTFSQSVSQPDSVMVDADTINTFKSRLDKHWLDQDVV